MPDTNTPTLIRIRRLRSFPLLNLALGRVDTDIDAEGFWSLTHWHDAASRDGIIIHGRSRTWFDLTTNDDCLQWLSHFSRWLRQCFRYQETGKKVGNGASNFTMPSQSETTKAMHILSRWEAWVNSERGTTAKDVAALTWDVWIFLQLWLLQVTSLEYMQVQLIHNRQWRGRLTFCNLSIKTGCVIVWFCSRVTFEYISGLDESLLARHEKHGRTKLYPQHCRTLKKWWWCRVW